jgi:hypothetical protein
MSAKKEDKKKPSKFSKLMCNNWAVASIILAIILVVSLGFNLTSAGISENKAGNIVLDFAADQGVDAEIISVAKMSGLYEVVLDIEGQEVPVYLTIDGENLIPSIVPIVPAQTQSPSSTAPTPSVEKAEVAKLELFVMTHCPYGTQAEKGFIPFMESLPEADTKIRFVHYFMHEPEEPETPRQVCIREEQSDKFLPYLKEFLKEGSTENALDMAGIDVTAMEECISSGRAAEYYAEDSSLSQAYGVQGSPTLVVNGAIASGVGRSPAAYLGAACAAFNEEPSACSSLALDSASPSPMWGWDDSGSATTAQC